jgi:hypothetical protein
MNAASARVNGRVPVVIAGAQAYIHASVSESTGVGAGIVYEYIVQAQVVVT